MCHTKFEEKTRREAGRSSAKALNPRHLGGAASSRLVMETPFLRVHLLDGRRCARQHLGTPPGALAVIYLVYG